ncbi:MAG: primosomal protein N' [Bacillota bacterium]|jgi:primosomal protein N' (replication factor Y)|nr:primosomal protein N' [Bacillota bacterium]NLJ02041.1 primosomal protein N' [Bacillota bacterium]
MEQYAGVIVDVRAEAVNRIFQYRIPGSLRDKLEIGHRVLVPFGRRKLEGYVVQLSSELEVEQDKLKELLDLLDPDPIILPSLVELARWMGETYVGLFSEALQYMLPPAFRYGKERVGAKTAQTVTLLVQNPKLRKNAAAQKRVVEILQKKQTLLAADLIAQADTSRSTLRALEEQGIIALGTAVIERKVEWDQVPDQKVTLTAEQKSAVETIQRELEGEGRPVLLHGVTGSGKTEVYLNVIADVIKQGKQAIVLVPEIALTPQTVSRFAARFGDRISVLHSGLSLGERFDQWWKTYRGEVDVVIGARSAVFAPTRCLGLIVLDEEHETTYKQEEGSIRYHARDVAIKRCELEGAQAVLGSATPALESYHKALQGDYLLAELTHRVEERPLPQVQVVDMRAEFERGNRSIFSTELKRALEKLTVTGNQAIILLNRRGFSRFVLCRECGEVIGCPNCQVSLTYHREDDRLHCHYCLHREVLPKSCPKCASRFLRQFGVGTEQVQEALTREFPELKSLRLDADTTRRKGAHASILRRFAQGQAQILVGTQMVAKGFDFPNVTLVGVLSADLSLNFPDIRSPERTFQLLTQVAGRSGRGEKKGEVIIQSYDPSHFAVRAAQNHDYLEFYRREIGFRRQLGYPPFRQLTRILCSGPQQAAEEAARQIHACLLSQGFPGQDVFGPAPAPIGRIQGRYRWQILLKSDGPPSARLRQLPPTDDQVLVTIDIDPIYML